MDIDIWHTENTISRGVTKYQTMDDEIKICVNYVCMLNF